MLQPEEEKRREEKRRVGDEFLRIKERSMEVAMFNFVWQFYFKLSSSISMP